MLWCTLAGADETAVTLSPVEEQFLQENPVIRVASEMDWTPFDFVENGEPNGYSIDLLRRIAQKTGLNLTWVNGYTWDELLSMGKARKVDVFPDHSNTSLFQHIDIWCLLQETVGKNYCEHVALLTMIKECL